MKKSPSYGIIKKKPQEGIFMPREYQHIKQYEKEMLELKEAGLTKREIGERLGISFEQVKGVLKRKRRREEKNSIWNNAKKERQTEERLHSQ